MPLPLVPVDANGHAQTVHAMPNHPALYGEVLSYQWFAAFLPTGQIVSSNGLRATIGQ